jgi:hypothetical protein
VFKPLAILALLAGAACAQPLINGVPYGPGPAQSIPPYNSATTYPANPYGPNIAPYYNQQEMRLPNQAWSNLRGEVIRPADDGLWLVKTSAMMPIGSVISVTRNGQVINGGKVIESGRGNALIKPWASQDLRMGDEVALEMVGPSRTTPVYDKFQWNRPAMHDPSYQYYTDYMHADFQPGRITPVFQSAGFFNPWFNGFR